MTAATRLKRLEKGIEIICGQYVKHAPNEVLEAIVEDGIMPTWAQLIAGDYELQKSIEPTNKRD